MKLLGRYNEYSLNEIYLYTVPKSTIKGLMKSNPDIERKVKEYRIKTYTKEDRYETVKITPDIAKRHQIVLIKNLGFLKISLYSTPMNSDDIIDIGLAPIEAVTKKEKSARAVNKLSERRGGTKVEIVKKTKEEMIISGVLNPDGTYKNVECDDEPALPLVQTVRAFK